MRTIHPAALAILFFAVSGCNESQSGGSSTLCALQTKVSEGTHTRVRTSGVYFDRLERRTIEDPKCAERATWVEFDLSSQENEAALRQSVNSTGTAKVVFEGDFYGPPQPDPKLPESMRKAFRPRWGHLGCCQTKLVVHSIKEVAHN